MKNLYCSFLGKCAKYLNLQASCTTDESCGRRAICHFNNPAATYGTCTELFSLADGADITVKVDNANVITENAHLLCRSGYATESGICSNGFKSLDLLEKCIVDKACKSDEDSIKYGKCRCAPDGVSYCDLLPGDTKRVTARDKF
jgi:hypothetical protein